MAKLESQLQQSLFLRDGGMVPSDLALTFYLRVKRAIDYLVVGGKQAAKTARSGEVKSFDRLITITQLRALIAVGEQGSFLGAARHLGTAQPSVFRAAKELEKLAGFALYQKHARGVDLTEAASHLYRAAKLAFNELGIGLEELRAKGGVDRGRLFIGSLPLSRSAILPRAIDTLIEDYPQARIHIVDGAYGDLLNALRLGDLDIMIGALRDPPPFEDVAQVKLLDDLLGAYAHPSHPAHARSFGASELAQATWVVSRKGTPARDQFDAFFDSLDHEGAKDVIETSSLIMTRGLLQSGARLAVLSKNQAAEEVRLGTMAALPIDLKDKPRAIGFTTRADWHPSDLQARFVEILRQSAEPA